MLYPIVTDQICTGKKLWGLTLCHILATFHILSKFVITTKNIPHSIPQRVCSNHSVEPDLHFNKLKCQSGNILRVEFVSTLTRCAHGK